jgi:broad specificity phosphatase PhoE
LTAHTFTKISFVIFLGMACAIPCEAQRVLVVVRHADKIDDSHDAALSPVGEVQAKRLAHVLKDLGITAIYTTQFRRTAQTAGPLAKLLKIVPFVYEQQDVTGVVKEIQRKHPTEVVMVVGHRSTVPRILKLFGSTTNVALETGEYDSLFILTLPSGRSPNLLHLRF